MRVLILLVAQGGVELAATRALAFGLWVPAGIPRKETNVGLCARRRGQVVLRLLRFI
jgi:hypothetical protein